MAKINDLPLLSNPTEDMYCLVGKDDLKKVPWSAIMGQIGSPYVATSISQMTDKTRVYVYYGEESGYIKGNWYYWNANTSAWTSGKKYNSEGIVTDETLEVSGKAADAKATGDKIKKTKEDLENALKNIDVTTDTTLTKTGKAADAKATGDAIKKVKEDVANIDVATDTTLAVSGKAADAKATGDKIKKISDDLKNTMPYYPIATEEQARAGVDDTVMMTPLKVAMACEEFGGSGGGGGNVNVATLKSSFTGGNYAYGSPIDIRYRFASPVSGDGTLHVMVDSVETVTETVPQGTNRVTLNDLNKGNHTITMYVVDASETFTDTLSFSVRVGTLDITSTFDDSTDFNIVNVIKVPITIDTISIDPIYLVQAIDGVETRLPAQNGYNVITLPTMSAGAHKVLFHAESGSYKSQTLTYNIIIEDADNLTLITDFDTKTIQYKDMLEIPYRVSMKGQTKFTAQYFVDDVVVKEVEIPSGTNVWATSTLDIGAHTLKILVTTKDGSKSAYIEENVIVQARDYTPMEPVKDASLLCWFDATGRTNQDIGKETWTDKSGKGVVATLHNFNYNTNGWENNALKCNGQAYVEIDLEALADNAPYGMTVDIRYNTRDVGNQDACVLEMRGNDTYSKGFAIDTEYMYMNSASSQLKSTVEQDSISKATFVIDRDNKIAKIYNNGVLTETFLMQDSENFTNNTKIFLGTKLETVDSKWVPNVFGNCEIYSFRVYARALDSEEIVKNFVADIPDMDEQQAKYLLNYENAMPTMYFYGDTSAMTKENKVPLRIKYISGNADEYGASFDLENCQVGWQGTSSLQYAVKNYKIKLKNPDGSKYKYSPFKNGILEDTFCLKADYMESSHANNTGMAKFINDELYDTKVPPQQTNSKVRTAINGFPIQLYIAKDSASTPVYMGVFNFNLDKGCNKSFGLDNEVTGQENCMSFEVSSNSDTSAGAFKNDTDESLRTDFELRYPDEDDCTSEQITEKYNVLKRLVTWVKNADETTFKNELEQYFNKEYLLKYFLQVHLFGMVDNLGKNMMLTTWDGNIWYPQFYDLDTQLGLDNTGYLKFYSDIDITEGVYNTSGSKLWTMVENVFADELSAMYKKLRTSKYRLDNILKYWYDGQVAQIGELQYNKDMEAKYIKFKNDYLFMLHGRRSEHMKKWVKERLLYLDTIYGYEEDTKESITIRANTTANINLDILTYSPQYLTVRWRNGVEQRLKVGRDANGMMKATRFNGTLATATDQEIIIYNAKQIKKIDGLTNANPSTLNLVEASRLVEVDCQNAKVLNDIRLNENNKFISKILLNGCSKLGDTSTGKSSTLDLSMFPMLTEVTFNNTLLTNVIFPTTGCNLKSLNASSEKLQSLILKNMPVLKNITTDVRSTFSEFTVEDCPEAMLISNYTHKNKTVCSVDSENISIQNCEKIFSNIYAFAVNVDCVNHASNIDTLKSLIIQNCGETRLPVMKIKGSSVTNTSLHLEKFKIDCNIGLFMMYGIGLKEKQTLNINCSKIDFLLLKKLANVSELKLTSNLKGLYLGSSTVHTGITEVYNGGCWCFMDASHSSKELKDYTIDQRIDKLYIDNKLITDTFDFSNNPKMTVLVLDKKIIPETATKAVVNCDFTKLDSDISVSDFIYFIGSYTQWQFYLPPTFEVEGNIKYSKDVKSWWLYGSSCSNNDTEYTPLANFDKLTVDYSEVENCSRLFLNCKNLTILPNSLTPEIFNRGDISYAFCNCINLTDLNKLEGMDINIDYSGIYSFALNAFENVKGPFAIGNVTINAPYSNYSVQSTFKGSGLTSIGNVTISQKIEDIVNVFNSCKQLMNVGNITLRNNGEKDIRITNFFYDTPNLKSIGALNVEKISDASNFAFNCGMEDFSFLNIQSISSMVDMFKNSNIKDMTTIRNYRELIGNTTNLNGCFQYSKLTSVPDLNIEKATSFVNVFNSCKQLMNVGNITIAKQGDAGAMFCNCSNLTTIGNITGVNITKARQMFQKCQSLATVEALVLSKATDICFLFTDDAKLTSIQSLDISSFTHDATAAGGNATNSQLGNNTGSITHIGFNGTLGKYFAYTNIARFNPLSLASITSMIECLETLTSPQTLILHATSFALLTEELITKASAKNWTLASA